MRILRHVKSPISNLLQFSEAQLEQLFQMDGATVRADLEELEKNGHLFIGPEDCEGFDPVHGCPGHLDTN